MNSTQRKTLRAVLANPVPKNLEWSRIESLLVACGCEVFEGRGSRVTLSKGVFSLDTHRPHPGKEAKPYQVRDVREFLKQIGITPQEEDL